MLQTELLLNEKMELWIKFLFITLGIFIFVFGMHSSLKIEQTLGYYKCANCNHKFILTYDSVFLSIHFGRTRYMKALNVIKEVAKRK